MLTRLYIDNFRCFEKFEWRPGRKQLILGRNGTGKSSVMDALRFLVETVARGERLEKSFKLSQRTRSLRQREQVFEVEAQLRGKSYVYRLVIEPGGAPARPRVQLETVHCDELLILKFEAGKVGVHAENGDAPTAYDLEPNRSAVSASRTKGVLEFRAWLSKVECFHLDPVSMSSRAEGEEVDPAAALTNMAAWYRHLVQANPKENRAFVEDLAKALSGFDQLRLEHAGENVRIFYVDFLRDIKSFRVRFDELSDGQRCLICLYAIVHFVVAKGGTVVIDEPDNFISLREIQPWLMRIDDMADDYKGQVILISHHPEILNQWAPAYGVQFIRDGAGPVRVEKFRGDPESPLSAAELVARGWDLE